MLQSTHCLEEDMIQGQYLHDYKLLFLKKIAEVNKHSDLKQQWKQTALSPNLPQHRWLNW